jgi:hypothetical protein
VFKTQNLFGFPLYIKLFYDNMIIVARKQFAITSIKLTKSQQKVAGVNCSLHKNKKHFNVLLIIEVHLLVPPENKKKGYCC